MKKMVSIDEYLQALPEKERAVLSHLRATIRATAPQAAETISYGMPIFKHHGHLVGFAAFRDHCSLFVMNSTYIAAHRDELKKFKLSKGTIQFSADQPLPPALVRKIVRERMRENESQMKARLISKPQKK